MYGIKGEFIKNVDVCEQVYSICVSASIQNEGYEKRSEFYNENSFYIDVSDSNIEGNPLMNFGDDDE